MQPTYYKALWHNCNKCRTHYMSEEPHLKAYLCDECWDNTPQFVVRKPKKEEMKQIDYKWWIALYSGMAIAILGIIGYQLWLK